MEVIYTKGNLPGHGEQHNPGPFLQEDFCNHGHGQSIRGKKTYTQRHTLKEKYEPLIKTEMCELSVLVCTG